MIIGFDFLTFLLALSSSVNTLIDESNVVGKIEINTIRGIINK